VAVFAAVPRTLAHEIAGGAVHSGRLDAGEQGVGLGFQHTQEGVGADNGLEFGKLGGSQLAFSAFVREFIIAGLYLGISLHADEGARQLNSEILRQWSHKPLKLCHLAVCHGGGLTPKATQCENILEPNNVETHCSKKSASMLARNCSGVSGAFLPLPAFEKVTDRETEARENVLTFQESGGANDAAVCARMAHFHKLFIGMDNPSDACAAGEEVGQPFVNLRAGVAGREDFNRQVGCAGQKGLGVGLETEPEQAFFRDKGNIQRAAVPVFHPKPHAGTEHSTEPVEAIEILQGEIESFADLFVLEIVLGTHNQFAIDKFMDVSFLGHGLKFGFRPGFPGFFAHRAHGGIVAGRRQIVNALAET
jgi:hypothetical protein